jgi:regulator of nucleoside diphosphate kinase
VRPSLRGAITHDLRVPNFGPEEAKNQNQYIIMTKTTKPTIHIPHDDYSRLSIFASAMPKHGHPDGVATLREELARATVVARELLPSGVVTVNSRVRFQDVDTGATDEYVIAWPDRADGGVERISVLAPIGTALLGYREGDEIAWPTPGGTRRLRVVEVEPVSDDSFGDSSQDYLSRLLYGPR